MINLDNILNNNNNKEHNGSEKTNTLLNLINELKYFDKMYLYVKGLRESKDEYLIKNR